MKQPGSGSGCRGEFTAETTSARSRGVMSVRSELKVVPATGLEPVQCYLLEPESSASANSATRA